MHDDDRNWDELERCDGCGGYFPRSQMKRCNRCGAVLCPSCRNVHACPPRRSGAKKFVVAGAVVLLVLLLAGTALVFAANTNHETFGLETQDIIDTAGTGDFAAQVDAFIALLNTIDLSGTGKDTATDAGPRPTDPVPSSSPVPTSTPTATPTAATNETLPTALSTVIPTSTPLNTVDEAPQPTAIPTTAATSAPRTDTRIRGSDPHIVLDTSRTGELHATVSFDAGDGITASVTADADAQVYSGAKLPQSLKLVSRDYWVMMTEDPAQDAFYDSLLAQFDAISLRCGFSDERYVEMVASYVQTIPYDLAADDIPQYPVVTAIDRTGDCDEKSMLLAGLLSRAGYDVALLLFVDANHMTAGIRTTDGSGYAVIETTYEGWMVSETDHDTVPEVFEIGTGTRKYGAVSQVDAILNYTAALDTLLGSGKLEAEADALLATSNRLHAAYEDLAEERDRAGVQMADLNREYETESMPYDVYLSRWTALEDRYDALTQETDAAWTRYEAGYAAYAAAVDAQNGWVDVYDSLVRARVCDRAALYAYIQKHPLPV